MTEENKMGILDNAIYVEANSANFSSTVRPSSSIKYVVMHYTGNVDDTARNNALYYREAKIQTSAHLFVDENDVYQSVPFNHTAYAVGLGGRKEPYIKWPDMWKKITNSNSISIEICGGKNSLEASEKTKRRAAKLAAEILIKFNLTPECVYRHYDVTGKLCPAWAVKDPLKWLELKLFINQYFYGREDDILTDTPENYQVFKTFMQRYLSELDKMPITWEQESMIYAESRGLIKDGRPKAYVLRGELAEVLRRLNA